MLPLPGPQEAIEVILKLPGESCNLNCSYCYEKRQPDESTGYLNPSTLRAALERFGDRPLSIGLHGGEPLLIGRERLSRLLAVLEADDRVTDIRLQTNGTLLNPEWLELLETCRKPVVIGVSYDGPDSLSALRVDYNDRPERATNPAALELLDARGIHFGVITVVSRSNLRHPRRLIEFLAQYEHLATLNLVPCFDIDAQSRVLVGASGDRIRSMNPSGRGLPAWAITPLEFLDYLQRVWSLWEAHPDFVIEPFMSVVRSIAGRSPESCDFTAEKCAHVLTLYPDGRVTSCDEFESTVADLAFNVLAPSSPADPWANDSHHRVQAVANHMLEKCTDCSHQSTCRGGCVATRSRYLGTEYYEDYCTYKRGLIDWVAAHLPSASEGHS